MNKNIQRGLVLVGSVVASGSALAATGPNMSALTGAVSFGTVVTAILSIAGGLAVVYVAVKGAQIGLRMLRGG